MDTAWIALIGTVFGGAGLKILETFLSKGAKEIDIATQLRTELRSESTSLKEELRILEKELDTWKEKYFKILQDYLEAKSHYEHTTGRPLPPPTPPTPPPSLPPGG